MNPADREELTIGYFAKRDFDMFEVSFGVRYDQIDTSGSLTEHHEEDGLMKKTMMKIMKNMKKKLQIMVLIPQSQLC